MKKILFPYEQTIDNRNAFVHAAKIARKTNAELIILHAFIFNEDESITQAIYQQKLRKKWVEVMDEITGLKAEYIADYAQKGGDLNLRINYRIIYGKMKTEINNLLEKEKIDLLVLTIPYEQVEEIELNGSAIKSILNNTSVPTLAVPEHHTYSPIEKIGYATNLYRVKRSELMLRYADHLARLFEADIHFIHVSKDGVLSNIEDKLTYQLMEKLIKNHPDRYSFEVIKGEDVLKAVSNYIKRSQIDLVIVIKQNRNFFEAMFHESFTNQISLYSREPILILHEGEDKAENLTYKNN